MEILLVGRTVQGAAGGLLAGLGYAVINTALPSSLWTKASALVSAMWGVGTLVGPAAGRPVRPIRFVALGFRCAGDPDRRDGRSGADRAACAARRRRRRRSRTPIPVWSLLLLGTAALAVSVAGIPHDVRATAALLALGAALVAVFIYVDRRLPAAVLPPSTFGSGPVEVDLPDARAC